MEIKNSQLVAPLRIARRPAAYETAEVLFLQGAMQRTHISFLPQKTLKGKLAGGGAMPPPKQKPNPQGYLTFSNALKLTPCYG